MSIWFFRTDGEKKVEEILLTSGIMCAIILTNGGYMDALRALKYAVEEKKDTMESVALELKELIERAIEIRKESIQ
jgi:hypothetical protein